MITTIKESHEIKARKIHVCQGCGKKIEIGEKVISSTFADGKDIWTFYECLECADYRIKHCFKCKDYSMCIYEDYYVGVIKDCKEESKVD